MRVGTLTNVAASRRVGAARLAGGPKGAIGRTPTNVEEGELGSYANPLDCGVDSEHAQNQIEPKR